MNYVVRTYRKWVEDKDLVNFTVKIGESDLFIRADKLLYTQAFASLQKQRKLLEDYIQKDREFADTLMPYQVGEDAPEIAKEMAVCASSCGVGPMAAVAGAIAEYVGKKLLNYSGEVIIENGGDIFMKIRRIRRVGIFAGKSPYTGKLALEITPREKGLGICTSSATVGPSLSFGQTDATVVICNSAILADAWATSLGNMVKSESDIEKTLEFVQKNPQIEGVVIIVGQRIGVWGEVKLIPIHSTDNYGGYNV